MKLIHRHLAGFLVAVTALSAHGHTMIQTASPKNGAVLATPPTEIRLEFNEPLEATFTTVKLYGASGREVTTQKAHVEPAKVAVMPLPVLPPGAYKAVWKSVGRDGHPVHGELVFTVK